MLLLVFYRVWISHEKMNEITFYLVVSKDVIQVKYGTYMIFKNKTYTVFIYFKKIYAELQNLKKNIEAELWENFAERSWAELSDIQKKLSCNSDSEDKTLNLKIKYLENPKT